MVGHQESRLEKLISFSGKGRTSGKQIMTAKLFFNHVSNMLHIITIPFLSEIFRHDGNASKWP